MPIDMDNMLPGFSSQLILTNASAKVTNVDTRSGADILCTACLREEDILDVGIVVTAVSADTYKVQFGRGDADGLLVTKEGDLVALTSVAAAAPIGTVYRVAAGNLAWAATADTESERRLGKGVVVTVSCDGEGTATGRFMPFVLMRGAEPLDPIA